MKNHYQFWRLVLSVIIVVSLVSGKTAWASSAFDLSISGQTLNVNTSKRLHYGVISKDDFIRADFDALFTKTTMINRQEAFFDLSQMGSGSLTQTPTSIDLATLGFSGVEKEFLLYTEFDRFSKPAVLNYATVGSIMISAASSTATGKKVADSVKNLLEGIESVSEAATGTVEITRTSNDTLIGILDLAGVPANHEMRRVPNSIRSAINRVDSVLGQFNSVLVTAQKTPSRPINDIYAEMQSYTGFQGGKTGANALYRHLLRLFTDDITKADDHLKAIMVSKTLQSTIVEVMVETMLEPFSYSGSFYYPKNGDFITPFSDITNQGNFEAIDVSLLARNITRYLKGDKLGDFPNDTNQVAAKRQIALAAKAISAAGGKKLLSRLENLYKELESTEQALQMAQALVDKAMNVSAADLFKFAKMLVETAAESVPDITSSILKQVAIRIASYGVPAAGWVKAAVDLGNLANTGGAFAYDVLTAPRQVPFVIADQSGTLTVFQPFAMDLKKYSYLRYPLGNTINTLDPFSNGQYPFESYFLHGNSPSGSFTPWNVNNRDATLVADGAAYSYDMVLGAGDASGFNAFKSLFDNQGDFADGLYDVNFDVLVYPNDNVAATPATFVSPLTGVTNSENQVVNENYLLSGIGINLLNTTDYRARHFNTTSQSINNYTGSDGALLSFDPMVSSTVQGQSFSDLYYLSFKDNFVAGLQNKYGATFSANYSADKGIMHGTPGVYLVKTALGIKAPLNTKATHPTKFEDKQLMFVMASVSNASSSQIYKDPQYIPYIGIPSGAGVTNRYFEFDQSRDGYNFVFAFKENNFKRKVRIALFNKDESDNFSDFHFITIDPSQDFPDANGNYRISVPDVYFNTDLNGIHYTKGSLRLAWYDAVATEYCAYSGVNESGLVMEMFLKNRAASQTGALDDAVRKVFMAQYLFGDMTALVASTGNGTAVPVVGIDTPVVDPDDTDNDGLPDAWEMLYFGNLDQDGSGDPDGDGMNNLLEYRNGTDPTKAGTAGVIESVVFEPYTVTTSTGSYTVSTFTPSGDIYANVYLKGGTLDLEGRTLTIYGNLYHIGGELKVNGGNLIVNGDYRIQAPVKDAQGTITGWGSSSGVLTMTNNADYVLVGKHFAINTSGVGYYNGADPTNMTAGTLEIKGDFNQLNPDNNHEKNFFASGTHRVVLSGSGLQTVSFQNPYANYSHFNILEIKNTSVAGVVFASPWNVITLLSNNTKLRPMTVSTMNWVMNNSESVAGDLTLSNSTLDLNGKTLTVEGNLIHTGGELKVNGGNLIVKGDYRIQTPAKDANGVITGWGSSSGILTMTNNADYVLVGKHFAINTSGVGYFNGADPTNMTAGTLEIKGDFSQLNPDNNHEKNFFASGTHRVVLSGSGLQTVSFQNPYANYSHFNILEIKNTSVAGVVFATPVVVTKELVSTATPITNQNNLRLYGTAIISGGNWIDDLTVDASWILQQIQVITKDLYLSGGTLDLNGKTLTIEGNLYHSGGELKVNGGNLIVNGDYRIQAPVKDAQGTITGWGSSSGVLTMTNNADYVLVGKHFAINTSGVGYFNGADPTNMTAGTLEIKGDFSQLNPDNNHEKNFFASGTHRVVLSGSGLQTVSFQNPYANYSHFNILEITNTSVEGVVFATKVVVTTLFNHHNNKFTVTDPTSEFPDYDGDGHKDHEDSQPMNPLVWAPDKTLTLNISGSGGGSVNSVPSGIACTSGACSGSFEDSSSVIISALADTVSTFAGWSGDCSGNGACNISMTADRTVTATFTLAPKAKIGTAGYDSLNHAYSGAAATATMLVLGSEHIENLTMSNGKNITVKGGYKADYLGKGDLPTVLKGALTIGTGSLTVDGLTIR